MRGIVGIDQGHTVLGIDQGHTVVGIDQGHNWDGCEPVPTRLQCTFFKF